MAGTYTPNLSLYKPEEDEVGWRAKVNGNFAILDAAITQFFNAASFQGMWLNATAYAEDDQVVDSTNSTVWKCLVAHTSAASPTTFSADRTANPTYWENVTAIAASGKGAWATATAYEKGDFVVSGTEYAVCVVAHTSGATFAGDAAYWEILIDVGGASVPDGAVDNLKFADPLTIPSVTTASGAWTFGAGLTVSSGNLVVSSGTTTLQGTTVQAGGLAITAGGLTVVAGGALIAGGISASGGIAVTSGGLGVVGNSTITGTLNVSSTLAAAGITSSAAVSVTNGGLTVVGNSTVTGTLTTTSTLTVSGGGIAVTGNSTITGTLGGITTLTAAAGTFTGNVTAAALIPSAATVPANGVYLPAANEVALATNTTERLRINSAGALLIATDAGTSGQILTSAGAGGPPTWEDGGGKVAQVVATTWSIYTTFTDSTPYDNTIPQNTEGAERFTLAITPVNASSTLYIEITLPVSIEFEAGNDVGEVGRIIAHLHRDSTADAIATGMYALQTNGELNEPWGAMGYIVIHAKVAAAAASATTFKLRSGHSQGGVPTTSTYTHNPQLFGGTMAATMKITEVLP